MTSLPMVTFLEEPRILARRTYVLCVWGAGTTGHDKIVCLRKVGHHLFGEELHRP